MATNFNGDQFIINDGKTMNQQNQNYGRNQYNFGKVTGSMKMGASSVPKGFKRIDPTDKTINVSGDLIRCDGIWYTNGSVTHG